MLGSRGASSSLQQSLMFLLTIFSFNFVFLAQPFGIMKFFPFSCILKKDHHSAFLLATCFLEVWKRKQAEISYDWDLIGFEDEEVAYVIK